MDEPNGPIAFRNQDLQHGNRRCQPDATGQENNRSLTGLVEFERTTRPVNMDDRTLFYGVMEPARNKTIGHIGR
ncbi:hypothetical protein D3C72_2349280 [compost metagenome]